MSRAGAIAASLAGAAALGGCGFTPLYATPGVATGLTHVDVVAPYGRVGYLLREDLDDALGKDKGAPPLWRLDMQVTQQRIARGLTVAGFAQRYELDLTVHYTLTEVATGKIAHSGAVVSMVSYDSTTQPYAGIAAREDTQDRLAADAARKIQLDLAAFMAGQPQSSPVGGGGPRSGGGGTSVPPPSEGRAYPPPGFTGPPPSGGRS